MKLVSVVYSEIRFEIEPLKCERKAVFLKIRPFWAFRLQETFYLFFEENSIKHHSVYLRLVSVDFFAITFAIGPLKCEPIAIFLEIMPFLEFCPQETFVWFWGEIPLSTILCT